MFYAVKKGKAPGIYETWDECRAATIGYPNAEYKKFPTKEEAEAYIDGRNIWAEQAARDGQAGYLVAYCDGSFSDETNRYSFGVVFILPDGTEASLNGSGSNPEYIESKNIIGEIFGVINALDWAVSNGFEKIKIYHDLQGLSEWYNGTWKAKTAATKMFVALVHGKYDGIIEIEFEKVAGHSNNPFNVQADALAKEALVDHKRTIIQGDHWFTIPYFKEADFEALIDIVQNNAKSICYTKTPSDKKVIYRLNLDQSRVTATLFLTGQQKTLVQGAPSFLFQLITSAVVELCGSQNVERIMGSAYRIRIDSETIDRAYNPISNAFPSNYPDGIKRLVRQSIINLHYYVDGEDYSQYVVPALRALEGHIKYLITSTGETVTHTFTQFNKDGAGKYVYTPKGAATDKKNKIETCYNFYKAQRDTISHFGDLLGNIDTTRIITNKSDADEIIQKCLHLICEQV